MKIKFRDFIPILFVAALVVLTNVAVMPILVGYYRQVSPLEFSATTQRHTGSQSSKILEED